MPNFTNQLTEEQLYSTSNPEIIHFYPQNEKQKKPTLKLKVSSALKYLALAAIALILLNLLVVISYQLGFTFPARDKFYFDREDSLPTYYSAILLLTAAFILSLIAVLKKKEKDSFTIHWAVLAIIFLGLSIDEAVSFHELLIEPLRQKFELTGYLRFSWVIAGGLFVVVFGIAYLKFFLALPPQMKVLFFVSGAIYVLGVIGFEMIGGSIYQGSTGVRDTSLPYMVVMTIEETLEIVGMSLFIYTLLQYIKSYTPEFKLSIV